MYWFSQHHSRFRFHSVYVDSFPSSFVIHFLFFFIPAAPFVDPFHSFSFFPFLVTQIVRGLSYFDSFYSNSYFFQLFQKNLQFIRLFNPDSFFCLLTQIKQPIPFNSLPISISCLSSLSLLYFLSVAHPHNRCIATWIFCHAVHIFYISLYEFANSFLFSYEFPKKISD